MRYAIYLPLHMKDPTKAFTMLAYGNWQNSIKIARANNSDLLRALKNLMKTRLKTQIDIEMSHK